MSFVDKKGRNLRKLLAYKPIDVSGAHSPSVDNLFL